MSAIRIVDRLTLHKPGADPQQEPAQAAVNLRLLVSLKAGEIVGESTVILVLRYPSGKEKSLPPFAVTMNGGVHGHSIVATLDIEVGEFGLYAVDVMWEGQFLTRIPLEIRQSDKPAEPLRWTALT